MKGENEENEEEVEREEEWRKIGIGEKILKDIGV